jgi:hypothetical protein
MRFLHLALILLLLLMDGWASPVSAEEPSVRLASDALDQVTSSSSGSDIEQQIRTQDREIILELVKLAEFNICYQQTVNHYARWRKVVYPLGQTATYACFLGFSLTDISQRSRAWNDPRLISAPSIKRALSSAMVGALLGAGSSMLELGADGLETVRANRSGFSIGKSVAFVQSTVQRVDNLLARRHALMEQGEFTGTPRELLELKEQLLEYERDRLVFEFKRWSAHSRGYAWYRNSFYVINVTVNMARFSAVTLGFKAFTQPKCSGATGPILITSAVLAGAGPIASSTIGNWMQRYQQRSLSKKLAVSTFLSDQEAQQKFERLAQLLASRETSSQHSKLASELVRLREEKLGLDTLIFHEDRKIQRLRRVAGQQAITAPAISTLGAASGILGTVGYNAYRQQPIINNRLVVAGDATLIPAEAVAILATPAAAILAERYERKLKRKGEHPDQLLAARLKDLKALEKMVTDAWR